MSNLHPYNDGGPLPGAVDYIAAIFTLGQTTSDDLLKGAVPRLNPRNPLGDPWISSGSYAIAFILERPGASHIVRCWTHSIGRADRHYASLKAGLKKARLPWLIDFEFLEEGIFVEEQWWPVLRMELVRGQPLHRFLREARGEPAILRQLAAQFLEMMCGLHAAKIAHGDLQNENILLRRNSRGEVEIRLIDYDTLAVPENYGTPTDNEGFPAFQHPTHKAPRSLGPRDDAFASLVIYLSILALAEDPDLWNDYGLDHCDKDNLLFTREDLLGPAPSEKFHRLRGLSQTVSNLTLILWNFLCCPSERHLPCLEDVVALASAELPVRDPAKAGGFDERIRRTKEWSRLAAERLPSTAVRKSAWLEEWDGEPARLLPK